MDMNLPSLFRNFPLASLARTACSLARWGCRHPFLFPLSAGLLVAELVAALHVGCFNLMYQAKVRAISAAGFITAPGGPALDRLSDPKAAVYGGLFFTLTVGLALSLGAWGAAWCRARQGEGGKTASRIAAILPAVLWVSMLVWLNHRGPALFASLYPALVCPLVYFLSLPRVRKWAKTVPLYAEIAHAGGLLLLCAMAFFHLNAGGFSNLRDHLLLSNPVGIFLTDLYYRYTLYPAQVFKAPAQDQMRTVRLKFSDRGAGIPEKTRRRIQARLIASDYFPPGPANGRNTGMPVVDLVLEAAASGDGGAGVILRWWREDRLIMETPAGELLRTPGAVLRRFSDLSDRHGPLRQMTFYGLLGALAVCSYAGLCVVFLPLMRFLLRRTLPAGREHDGIGPGLAGILSAAAGLSLLLTGMVWLRMPIPDSGRDPDILRREILAADFDRRLSAYKEMHHRRLPFTRELGSLANLDERTPLERYWIAKTLLHTRRREGYALLARLCGDKYRNVAYTAISNIGKLHYRQGIPLIRDRLMKNDDWYIQMYAYRTLKKLGWRQKPPAPPEAQ